MSVLALTADSMSLMTAYLLLALVLSNSGIKGSTRSAARLHSQFWRGGARGRAFTPGSGSRLREARWWRRLKLALAPGPCPVSLLLGLLLSHGL